MIIYCHTNHVMGKRYAEQTAGNTKKLDQTSEEACKKRSESMKVVWAARRKLLNNGMQP